MKGVPFTFIDMDSGDFQACAKATGIAQMPQVEAPDGTWLTDTTPIIARFEDETDRTGVGLSLRPSGALARVCSIILEDLFDEWLWRPALYYRWAFPDDNRLMSAHIARGFLRDWRLPFWIRRRFILMRQRREFLSGDGVTRKTAPQVEALYGDVLDILEPIFRVRPFLFGNRPCEADFGLFGPMFRHFSIDPTPAAIMRERAPNVLAWTARLWATRPEDLSETHPADEVPEDLAPLLRMAGADYVPYLIANGAALREGRAQVAFEVQGVPWRVPVAPYRSDCLRHLVGAMGTLDEADGQALARLSGGTLTPALITQARDVLDGIPERTKPVVDRLWR